MVRAVLLLFAYKYNLFQQKNKRGELPIDLSYSTEIANVLNWWSRIMPSKVITDTTPSSSSGNAIPPGTKTAIGKNPEHVLLSMDGGGIRGLVIVRVEPFLS